MNLLDDISHQPQQPASPCTVQQEVDRDVEMIVEMTDDPPTQNETEDSEVNNSIFEHTQAKLPPSWGWCSVNKNQQEDHPKLPRITGKRRYLFGFLQTAN